MNNIIKRTWRQGSMVIIEDLRGVAFQAEEKGHTFEISAIDAAGEPVELSGTPAGVMLRCDNQDVALDCAISEGKVTATLPANAYAVPGRFALTIFLTSGGEKMAIYAAVGNVKKTNSGTVAPPAGDDVTDLISRINTAINAIPVNYNAAFAVAYENLTFPVKAGTLCIYDGALKKATVDIPESETYTAAHWINANFATELSSLKSAFAQESYYTQRDIIPVLDIMNDVAILANGSFDWRADRKNSWNTDSFLIFDNLIASAGDIVTVGTDYIDSCGNQPCSIVCYDSNGTEVTTKAIGLSDINGAKYNYTLPTNTAKIKVVFRIVSNSSGSGQVAPVVGNIYHITNAIVLKNSTNKKVKRTMLPDARIKPIGYTSSANYISYDTVSNPQVLTIPSGFIVYDPDTHSELIRTSSSLTFNRDGSTQMNNIVYNKSTGTIILLTESDTFLESYVYLFSINRYDILGLSLPYYIDGKYYGLVYDGRYSFGYRNYAGYINLITTTSPATIKIPVGFVIMGAGSGSEVVRTAAETTLQKDNSSQINNLFYDISTSSFVIKLPNQGRPANHIFVLSFNADRILQCPVPYMVDGNKYGVNVGDASSLPASWASLVQTVQESQGKKFTFAIQTDTHYYLQKTNSEDEGSNLKYLTNYIGFDFVANLGDVIHGYDDETIDSNANMRESMTEIMHRYITGISCPFMVSMGNHDMNPYSQTLLSFDEIWGRMFRPSFNTMPNAVTQTGKMYYYMDYDDVRVIMLNTQDNSGNFGVGSDQVNWFTNTALDTDKWILILSHVPLVDEFNTNYDSSYANIVSALQTFKTGGGKVIGCMAGHTHTQESQTVDGILYVTFLNGGNNAEAVLVDFGNKTFVTTGFGSATNRNLSFN